MDAKIIKALKKVRIYDNQGETFDQFTAVFMMLPERQAGMFSAVGMSEHPFSPQGFGQHCPAMPGKHLGKQIKFQELPKDCQKLILQDLQDII
jgi:hypothetical protein